MSARKERAPSLFLYSFKERYFQNFYAGTYFNLKIYGE